LLTDDGGSCTIPVKRKQEKKVSEKKEVGGEMFSQGVFTSLCALEEEKIPSFV